MTSPKVSIEEQKTLLELATALRAQDAATQATTSPAHRDLEAASAELDRLVSAAGSAQLAVDDMELEILRIQDDERKLRRRVADDTAQLSAATDNEQR